MVYIKFSKKDLFMNQINVANDIVPVAVFKGKLSQYLNNVKLSGRPMVITQNGKPAGVLIAPKEFDDLVYQRSLMRSISRGLQDIQNGEVLTSAELRAELASRRA